MSITRLGGGGGQDSGSFLAFRDDRRPPTDTPKEEVSDLKKATSAGKGIMKLGKLQSKLQNSKIKNKGFLTTPEYTYKYDGTTGTMTGNIFKAKTDGILNGMFAGYQNKIEIDPLWMSREGKTLEDAANLFHEKGMDANDIEAFTGYTWDDTTKSMITASATNTNIGPTHNYAGITDEEALGQLTQGNTSWLSDETNLSGLPGIDEESGSVFDNLYTDLDEDVEGAYHVYKDTGKPVEFASADNNITTGEVVTAEDYELLNQADDVKNTATELGSKLAEDLKTKWIPQQGTVQKPILQVGKAVANIGKGGMKGLFQANKVAAAAEATALAGGATAEAAKLAATQASSGGLFASMAGMGPAGWAMMALNLLGGKLFKKHTLLGKIFSDKKLKKNIKYIGKSKSGIPIVRFNYIKEMGIPGRYQGVLSKDVPWATETHKEYGYDMVDYSKLDVEFSRID